MITIAIIDDGVNPAYLAENQPFTSYTAIGGAVKNVEISENVKISENTEISENVENSEIVKNAENSENVKISENAKNVRNITHGTSCYQIIRAYTSVPFSLISLQVLDTATNTGSKNSLVTALNWCKSQKIDLINMSMGTRQFYDFSAIAKAIAELDQTVIVAACSNQNTITLPACLDSVIGVRHCNLPQLREKYSYISDPYDKVDIMTYSNNASNSMAAPFISAKVCDLLASGITGTAEIRRQLQKNSVPCSMDYQFFRNLYPDWQEITVPIVAIDDLAKIAPLVDLFIEEDYRAVVLPLAAPAANISLADTLNLHYNHTLPNIIFLNLDWRLIKTLPANMQADAAIFQLPSQSDIPHILDISDSPQSLLAKIEELLG